MVKTYRDLEVWQAAMSLVESVYRMTRSYPRVEAYSLTDQTRRSAVSVASNIAEGHGRGSQKQFLQFLTIARGSLAELETQLLVGKRLNYVDRDALVPVWNSAQRVGQLLGGMIRSVNGKSKPPKGAGWKRITPAKDEDDVTVA